MHAETGNEAPLPEGKIWSIPLRITVVFALVGGLWILFSDAALLLLVEDPRIFLRLETLKGWLFIGVTASTLYLLLRRDFITIRQSEEVLRESEERYRVIAETASDGITTIDEESTIVFLNDSGHQIFGYEDSELIGQKLTVLMPERLRSRHLEAMKRYRETGKRKLQWKALEMPGLHKTGLEIPLEISYGEFVKEGKRYFTGIVRDVSERKAAEKEREYQRALEQLNRELETVVAERTMSLMAMRIADRVRNPSAVIRGTIRRLYRRDGMPDKSREEIG
jgi:PAS domain S-box-containing protein